MKTHDITATVRSRMAGSPDPMGECGTVHGYLSYDPYDPHAITVNLYEGEDVVRWVFARDLLREGFTDVQGIGDVSVWPDSAMTDRLVVRFLSPEGICLLYLHDRNAVRAWVRSTYDMVPAGSEPWERQADRFLRTLGLGVTDDA